MVLREKLMQPKWLALWLPLHLQRLLFMIEIQIGNALLVLLVMQEFHLTQTSSVYLSEKFYLWMGVNPSHSIGLLQVTISERLVISMARSSPKLSYEPLFTGVEDVDITGKRNGLWERRIKAKIVAAAASGKDLEETGSEDDGLLDQSDDDFFLSGSSSDEADADDEWTDKSTREQASSASGKAASGMSSDERNQRQNSARALMPPPRPSKKPFPGPSNDHKWFGKSSSKKPTYHQPEMSTSSNTSNSIGFRNQAAPDPVTGNSDNVSSVSDARKPKRKRRPKKKNKQT